MNGQFTSKLVASPLDDGVNWMLAKDLKWRWNDGYVETVKKGFITDYASVPDLAFWFGIVGAIVSIASRYYAPVAYALIAIFPIIIFANKIDNAQQADAPAVFHDQDYRKQDKSKWTADAHLFIRMKENGCNLIVCVLYWLNLTLFGWPTWWKMKPK